MEQSAEVVRSEETTVKIVTHMPRYPSAAGGESAGKVRVEPGEPLKLRTRVFRLTLRDAQVFIDSIFTLMGVPLRCPE